MVEKLQLCRPTKVENNKRLRKRLNFIFIPKRETFSMRNVNFLGVCGCGEWERNKKKKRIVRSAVVRRVESASGQCSTDPNNSKSDKRLGPFVEASGGNSIPRFHPLRFISNYTCISRIERQHDASCTMRRLTIFHSFRRFGARNRLALLINN